VTTPLVPWKGDCTGADQCQVGFHCDFFTQRCEEACRPGQTCGGGAVGCCVQSGGDTCTPDGFGLTANCNP
jgi:hypothetical protein